MASIHGHGRRRPKKSADPVVAEVTPEVVVAPAPAKKREYSDAHRRANATYYEKQKIRKEAENIAAEATAAAELAKPLSESWSKARAILSEADPERYAELTQIDSELNELLYWVRNIEEGLEQGLQLGVGCQDSDFREDGTAVDINHPTMEYPDKILAEVRAAIEQYGTIQLCLMPDEARRWSDFDERSKRDPEFWKYGLLIKVPTDTQFRVERVIKSLSADKVQVEKPLYVSMRCARCADIPTSITSTQAEAYRGKEFLCGPCQTKASKVRDFNQERTHPESILFDTWGRVKAT